tara:strand:+ start:672 stop:1148 length:477 start_codon:yes stop_codon:yes gene_type:complete
MKKEIASFMVCLLLVLVFKSCTTDDANPEEVKVTSADMEAIKAAVKIGEWRISYYFDTDNDQTADYADFVFTFKADGSLGATDGNTAISGAWSVSSSDNSNDDSNDDSVDFNITFSSPAKFLELSEDWEIIEYSGNSLGLKDVSGGNGGTDLLTFEKN